MNSLEWRVKKLENKILGRTAGLGHVERILNQSGDQESILDQLNAVAKQYNGFLNITGQNYPKFVELYQKYKTLFNEFETTNTTSEGDETSKAELVLAYEDEIINYIQDLKDMAEKADRVLNLEQWPDLSGFQERLNKLQTITKEQHIQSVALDKRTEELIEIYNDIIGSFKSNTAIWNQRLETYENADIKPDEDE